MEIDQDKISRVNRSKNHAKMFYNKISKCYDLFFHKFEKKYTESGISELSPKRGETILEIGFGAGHGIIQIAKMVDERGKVYGIDISDRMLKIAQLKAEQAKLSDRIVLVCDDASKLHFSDGMFDAIFMSFTLELFDNPEIPVVLNECRRVLKKNGRIVIVSLSRRNVNFAVKLYEWLHNKFPGIIDCRPIYLKEIISQNGFSIINFKAMSMFCLPVDIILALKA